MYIIIIFCSFSCLPKVKRIIVIVIVVIINNDNYSYHYYNATPSGTKDLSGLQKLGRRRRHHHHHHYSSIIMEIVIILIIFIIIIDDGGSRSSRDRLREHYTTRNSISNNGVIYERKVCMTAFTFPR